MLKIWDADNFRRTLAGLCCFAAPATLLLTLLVHPGDGSGGLVTTVADEPGRIQAAALLTMLSAVLFVPALVGIAHLVRGRGVVLVHLGVALMIVGAIGHAVFAGFQIVLAGALQRGVDQDQLSAMVDATPVAGFVVVLVSFLLGFFPGLLLLAAALWRSKVGPAWAPLGLVAMAVADFVPMSGGRLVAAVVPALGVVGFGALGWVLLRTSDADWSPSRVVESHSQPVMTP
jgi:hypothetical protein